jgi:hypothetical protein
MPANCIAGMACIPIAETISQIKGLTLRSTEWATITKDSSGYLPFFVKQLIYFLSSSSRWSSITAPLRRYCCCEPFIIDKND